MELIKHNLQNTFYNKMYFAVDVTSIIFNQYHKKKDNKKF